VTFLFTDVEASTRSWEEHPADMDVALRQHDELVRHAIQDHGGYVFSTAGDSFAASFHTAHQGLGAAVALQRSLDAAPWPDAVELRVRAGLHTGAAVERDGDYFGPVVNRGARLMSAAHGGQIVCSQVTADLCRGEMPRGVRLRSLGELRLRDLLEPVRICEVLVDGLTRSFPPLFTLDRARHNLPVQRNRLIGREAEVAHVVDLVRQHRLVTLTGAGGSGKTRLAIAVAAELTDDFGDGVFLVELAPVVDQDRIPDAVAEALEVQVAFDGGDDRRLVAVARFLASQDVLIVLDNCEHLLDGVASFVEELMAASGRARLFLTSREALGLDGEQHHRVPTLEVADDDTGLSPAIELFVERARQTNDELILTDGDWKAVADICRGLDGLPLAIELAAAQLSAFSPAELLARLGDRFDVLVGGRGRRPRQQTLQAVMEWSWELLDPAEQRTLAALAVFSGGWTLGAAQGVCDGVTSKPVALVLRSLVDKSLVEPTTGPRGTRYRLLETVRLFALQRLAELDLAEDVRARHCAWFVSWCEEVPFDIRLASFAHVSRFADDLDNVLAAVEWAASHDEVDSAANLVSSGGGLWIGGVGTLLAVRWTRRLLAGRTLDPHIRARLLLSGSFAATTSGDHAELASWATEATDLAQHGDQFVYAIASIWQAAPIMVPEPERGRRLMDQARHAANSSGSSLGRGLVDAWELVLNFCVGDVSGAVVSPADAERFGGRDAWGWNAAVQVAVIAEAELGDLDRAVALLDYVSDTAVTPVVLRGGYEVLATAIAGDTTDAVRLAAVFRKEVERTTTALWRAELVLALGIIAIRDGDPVTGLTYIEAAKRAPMFFPFWYSLAHRYAARARAQLEEDAIASARSAGRASSIQAILDRELRGG
jgi:predicted ATPase/class 3 adenylate cyclase